MPHDLAAAIAETCGCADARISGCRVDQAMHGLHTAAPCTAIKLSPQLQGCHHARPLPCQLGMAPCSSPTTTALTGSCNQYMDIPADEACGGSEAHKGLEARGGADAAARVGAEGHEGQVGCHGSCRTPRGPSSGLVKAVRIAHHPKVCMRTEFEARAGRAWGMASVRCATCGLGHSPRWCRASSAGAAEVAVKDT